LVADGKRSAFGRASDLGEFALYADFRHEHSKAPNLHRLSPEYILGVLVFRVRSGVGSPTGRSRFAYWSYGYGIAITDADGGTPRSVFADPHVGSGSKPAWSPDGGSLAVNTPGMARGGSRFFR
jgi:hypothetical protein